MLTLTPLELIDRIAALVPPPRIAPARGPPLCDECDAQVGEGADGEPDWVTDWDRAAHPAPDYEADQSVNW